MLAGRSAGLDKRANQRQRVREGPAFCLLVCVGIFFFPVDFTLAVEKHHPPSNYFEVTWQSRFEHIGLANLALPHVITQTGHEEHRSTQQTSWPRPAVPGNKNIRSGRLYSGA
jgi:hypothetical protein